MAVGICPFCKNLFLERPTEKKRNYISRSKIGHKLKLLCHFRFYIPILALPRITAGLFRQFHYHFHSHVYLFIWLNNQTNSSDHLVVSADPIRAFSILNRELGKFYKNEGSTIITRHIPVTSKQDPASSIFVQSEREYFFGSFTLVTHYTH